MKTRLKTRVDVDYDEESDEDEDNAYEYKDSDEEEEKEDRRIEKGEIDEMSKMKKFMKTRARGDIEYNRNDTEY